MVLMRRICYTINTIFFDAYTQYSNITRIVVMYFEVCFLRFVFHWVGQG